MYIIHCELSETENKYIKCTHKTRGLQEARVAREILERNGFRSLNSSCVLSHRVRSESNKAVRQTSPCKWETHDTRQVSHTHTAQKYTVLGRRETTLDALDARDGDGVHGARSTVDGGGVLWVGVCVPFSVPYRSPFLQNHFREKKTKM